MKHMNKIIVGIVIFWLLLASISSLYIYKEGSREQEKAYNVAINRVYNKISHGSSVEDINLSSYQNIESISELSTHASADAIHDFFNGKDIENDKGYRILPIFKNKELVGYVRFVYKDTITYDLSNIITLFNIALAILMLAIITILCYVKQSIIKPFHEIVDLPYEMSRGHLNVNIKENKSRLFGKFLWGIDLLRQSLESHKNKELQLEKEKKTLILSISHDIKTPLSTIKLYAKALYDNLYYTEQKRMEVAKSIEEKANEIEGFVKDIIATTTTDILDITINTGEFYLSELIKKIHSIYDEKLNLLMIDFIIDKFEDILLNGDMERLIEVFENIIENAIKYGDGKNITITFADEDYCKLITVRNTGMPITETELIHVFESFWRGSNAHEKSGNGLGLYICKEIMKKMQGDIFAQRSSNSMGVTVVVRYCD